MALMERRKMVDLVNTMSTYEEFLESLELAKKFDISMSFRQTNAGMDIQYGKVMRILITLSNWGEDYYKVLNHCKSNYYVVRGR